MKRLLSTFLVAAAVLAACSDNSPVAPVAPIPELGPSLAKGIIGTLVVTTTADAGAGSFREASVIASSNSSIKTIDFAAGLGPIALNSTVTFLAKQALTINGNGTTIDAALAGGTAMKFLGGGNVRVTDLTVRNAPGEGIAIEVPATAKGLFTVGLVNVAIEDNLGHGVLVNDQVDPSTTDNVQPDDRGSDASLEVNVVGSTFERNGFSVSDRDGLRVNEGGRGTLTLNMSMSTAADNAADGVEIDERGAGDVVATVTVTQFLRNGVFDPTDLDDGFDIDEYNDGSVRAKITNSLANDNYEEGFDLNENNTGDFRLEMTNVEASGNREEGIDLEEDDDDATFGSVGGGDLVATLISIKTNGNGVTSGDAGLKIREKLLGGLDVLASGVESSNNFRAGISVREDGVGNLVSRISNATVLANTGHGIDFDENAEGNLTAAVSNSSSSNNTLFGIRADQQLVSGAGTGTLTLTSVTLSGNTGGTTTGSNVTVTIVP